LVGQAHCQEGNQLRLKTQSVVLLIFIHRHWHK